MIEVNDLVYSFNEVLCHIDLKRYSVEEEHKTGSPKYDEEKLMKVVLFGLVEEGYVSTRRVKKLCKTDIRFLWLLDGEKAPSHMTIDNFINQRLKGSIEEIFQEINAYIFEKESVDLGHIYIDESKIMANANRYSWVWKKNCETNRKKVFTKVSGVLEEMNHTAGLELQGVPVRGLFQLSPQGQMHRAKGNRTIRLNQELTSFLEEVLTNLHWIHGALLRMNRSIQAEGAFGGIKWNCSYNRARRWGLDGLLLETVLISCGFNLHKFHFKSLTKQLAA